MSEARALVRPRAQGRALAVALSLALGLGLTAGEALAAPPTEASPPDDAEIPLGPSYDQPPVALEPPPEPDPIEPDPSVEPPRPERFAPEPAPLPEEAPPGELGERGEQGKKGKKKRDPNDPHRLEWGVLPAVSYDIDLGLGFGALVTLARFHPGYQPYRWRLEILAQATVKNTPGVGLGLPYHNDYVKADFPGLLDGRLRINAAVRFRRFLTQGWYGLGNASSNPEPWTDIDPDEEPEAFREARLYNRYDRIYPSLDFNTRLILWDRSRIGNDVPRPCGPKRAERCPPYAYSGRGEPVAHKQRLELLLGTSISYNFINTYANSKLEADIETRDGEGEDAETLQGLLYGTDNHALWTLNFGLLYDTRDHEYTPTRGSFTELSGQISPGIDGGLLFGHIYAASSVFVPLYDDYLVLATRGSLDMLVGRPPLYQLGQIGVLEPQDGPGGSWTLRGVPRQRYFGKQKAILNVELRSIFYRFNLGSQRFGLGALAFVDAGRLWTDFSPVFLDGEDIDGPFGDIKVGVGGGLRITWGETLVIRVDPAWSPSDENFGFYLDVAQLF
ncbi:BamA/TamA family outer membrane protein [Pseudenhygromyxa sp. WMMC2535]|uniref:BamA/TamA family outer membrane protein n=1 Tax=Pseudenhygromyxa sp. WMMC2535 TaxID=2712867 RepID=UPI00159598FB|nr:BamA/TamA family outer membrane protein [Pseudenhygromyxa sp. WMMC2535]NVB38714.1 BamA/TamA family outer membrane protein [Pseudenhygromyxa sp. WMMC2535]